MWRQIKDGVKFSKDECELNPDMRTCGVVEINQKFYTNMSPMLPRHTGVVDVKLAEEAHSIMWGLRSSSPLTVLAIQTLGIFIRGCYQQYPDFLCHGVSFWLGLKLAMSSQAWAHQKASV